MSYGPDVQELGERGRGKGKAWSGSIGLNWGGALEFVGWDQEFDMAGCGI